MQRLGFREVAFESVDLAQGVKNDSHGGMIFSESTLPDGERSLQQGLSLFILFFLKINIAEIVQGEGEVLMIRPQYLLVDRQRAQVDRFGLLVVLAAVVN